MSTKALEQLKALEEKAKVKAEKTRKALAAARGKIAIEERKIRRRKQFTLGKMADEIGALDIQEDILQAFLQYLALAHQDPSEVGRVRAYVRKRTPQEGEEQEIPEAQEAAD